MRNKILFIILLLSIITTKASCQEQTGIDSAQAKSIDQEAQADNFIHAYLLLISEGKPWISTFGHTAIRLVCPSKSLDYCFSFEMDMQESSYWDVARRKAKAGFASVPSETFIKQYQTEGRGITAYELNLSPKEKQNLWKILDQECLKGATWNFDFTSINCTSMALYAINKAIEPAEVKFKKLPQVVYDDWGIGINYITQQSPWVRICLHLILYNVDDKQLKPEDLLMPNMMGAIIPYAVITDKSGNQRELAKGKPYKVLQQTYFDEPCWLTPTKVLLCMFIMILFIAFIIYKRKKLFVK